MKTFLLRAHYLIIILLFLPTLTTLKAQGWSELGSGSNRLNADGLIFSTTTDRSGNVYAAGGFTNTSGYYYVAKWDGTRWSELGSGANALQANGPINSIAIDSHGNVYAAGQFYDKYPVEGRDTLLYAGTDSVQIYYVAKWDGSNWNRLGTDTNFIHLGTNSIVNSYFISSIAVDNSDNIYAGGYNVLFDTINNTQEYYVAKWDGTTWSHLGSIEPSILTENGSNISSIVIDHSQNVYITGESFYDSNGNPFVAKWNGSTWNKLGTAVDSSYGYGGNIRSLTVDHLGNIYVGGSFNLSPTFNVNHLVFKWDGTQWNQLGAGIDTLYVNAEINTVATDYQGNVYAGGNFTDVSGNCYVAKWDGTHWSALDIGSISLASAITFISVDSAGNIFASGDFFDTSNRFYVAQWSISAPLVTSVINSTNNSGIALYPNPTASMVNLIVSENGQLSIYNDLGKLIASQHITTGNSSINLNQVPSGTYTFLFSGQSSSYAPVKLVKE